MPRTFKQSIVFIGLVTAGVLFWGLTLLAGYQWGYQVGYWEGRARQTLPVEQLREEYDPLWPAVP